MNKIFEPMIVFGVLACMVTIGIWYLGDLDGEKAKILLPFFGVILGAFTASVNYVVGSSAGSARKDKPNIEK